MHTAASAANFVVCQIIALHWECKILRFYGNL